MTENPTDNLDPTHSPIRVGLVADEPPPTSMIDHLLSASRWNLVGTAGKGISQRIGDVPWFDDQRVMITTSKLDALILLTSTRNALDLGETAAARDLPTWRMPPLGRSFAEATQLAGFIEKRPQPYRVSSWWDHVREPIRRAMRQEEDFKPRFSEIYVRSIGPSVASWRAGVVDAGGGVMTLDAYAMLEALVALRGLPDNVSAATGKFRRHPDEAPRETEDVACAILRYDGGGVVQITATWDMPPHTSVTRHHGATGTVEFTAAKATYYDRNGNTAFEQPLPSGHYVNELQRFGDAIESGEFNNNAIRTIDRHIAVTALLEAIYLSARTWHPETPRKFYEVQGWREHRD